MVCTKKLFKLSEICYKKRMKKKYPSDITKEQIEQLRSILESGRTKIVPRKVDLYEVFCLKFFQNGIPFNDGVKALYRRPDRCIGSQTQ